MTRRLTREEIGKLRDGLPPELAVVGLDLSEVIEGLVAEIDSPALRPYRGNCPCCAQAQLEFRDDPRKVECGNCGAVFDASLVLEPGFPRSDAARGLIRAGIEAMKGAFLGHVSSRALLMTQVQWEQLQARFEPGFVDQHLKRPGYVYEWPEVGHYDGLVIQLTTGSRPTSGWRMAVEGCHVIRGRGQVLTGKLTAYREPRAGDPVRITLPTGAELDGVAHAFEHYAITGWWAGSKAVCGVLLGAAVGDVPVGSVIKALS